LDVDALKTVANSLKEYQEKTNCSILLVTHNPRIIEILNPDYIHIIKDKKIIKTGDASLAKEIELNGFKSLFSENAQESND
ncbi:MAG TPA: ABC transporter ATP-binding protein, partial [Candidatus Coprovivens excrementavium]|nr:ABC transporter ATP-binding protein [Candidatus Coprovivens excrementavium]